MKFVAIVGTNASFSYNRKLLWYMKKHFNNQAQIEVLEITDVPLFSEDTKVLPHRVAEIIYAIQEADGVIFSTPEYDHSISAGLKSLLEWLSWGAVHPLTNTPVMIVGVSLGQMGTVFAQENLRQILSSPGIDAFVLSSNQFMLGRASQSFNAQDELHDERTIEFLETCFKNFEIYTEHVKSMRDLAEDRTTTITSPSNSRAIRKVEQKPLPKIVEHGEGWWIEEINLGFALNDANTGSSSKEELNKITDEKTGASSKSEEIPTVLAPDESTQIIEKGNGWWIEKIALSTGASNSNSKNDTDTSASQTELLDSDSDTGASEHESEVVSTDSNTGASTN